MTSFDNTPENNEQIQPSSTGYQLTQKTLTKLTDAVYCFTNWVGTMNVCKVVVIYSSFYLN